MWSVKIKVLREKEKAQNETCLKKTPINNIYVATRPRHTKRTKNQEKNDNDLSEHHFSVLVKHLENLCDISLEERPASVQEFDLKLREFEHDQKLQKREAIHKKGTLLKRKCNTIL
jgi:hypothetical protein